MQPVDTAARRYDARTMFFHWATAVLIAVQWLGAQTIDWFPTHTLRVDAKSVHITLGVLLTALLAVRIVWRLTQGRRLPLADHGALNVLAKATHWGLYALVAAMLLLGFIVVWTQGDNIFNLFSIPAYDPNNHDLGEWWQGIHGTVGWIILALAGVHAGAALVHRYLWRDGVLARMLPGREPAMMAADRLNAD